MIGPDLNTICNGHLQREFARLLPDVLMAARETGKEAAVTLKIMVKCVDGEPGIPPAYYFTATARSSIPPRGKAELYNLSDGKLFGSDVTLSLPFGEDKGAGDE